MYADLRRFSNSLSGALIVAKIAVRTKLRGNETSRCKLSHNTQTDQSWDDNPPSTHTTIDHCQATSQAVSESLHLNFVQ